MIKLPKALEKKYSLDPNWQNKIVNIGGGPIVNLEEISLQDVQFWKKQGKLTMLIPIASKDVEKSEI